jgi:hypothetical protein
MQRRQCEDKGFSYRAEQLGLTLELRPLLALYREAMSSRNYFCRFLCFYKICEGVRSLRTHKAREAKRRALSFSRPDERLPMDDFVRDWFPSIAGETFDQILDKVLKADCRHAAHPVS